MCLITLELFERLKYKGGTVSTHMGTDEDHEFDALMTKLKTEAKAKKEEEEIETARQQVETAQNKLAQIIAQRKARRSGALKGTDTQLDYMRECLCRI